MDVKCPGCYKIITGFSHALTVLLCVVQQCCAIQQEERPDTQKGVHLEERNANWFHCIDSFSWHHGPEKAR
ncbi:LOW QUALITY PROTEIN: hypothetical protein MC885_019380 [Smutsia gigantea]|nr:LOW QUALITY PROTEIN: hypothetical protein MC885_019380 [Smutsia gigantea]